jgi:predicted ATPase
MGKLDLALLGAPLVTHDAAALAFPTRKALALLLFLAVEGGAQARPRLAALLWPEHDAEHARMSLRRALGQLRDVLGERAAGPARHLEIGDETVRFISDGAALDLDALRALAGGPAAISALEAAAERYRGDFLEGFGLPDAPEFDSWASVQRERWHGRMASALSQLALHYLDAGQLDLAIATALRLTAHDPLDELAHQRLIGMYAAAGQRAQALRAYAQLEALLARELGVAPAPETAALVAWLRESPAAQPAAAPAPRRAAAHGAQLPELPLAGRAGELQHLIGRFGVARDRGAQVVAIEGEAGIGKTRLALEFLRWAGAAGADVLRGRAFEAGGRVPYQPLVDALRPRLERENAPADLLDDVWLAELARLLPELRERYPDLAQPQPDEPTARVRLFESVALLLAALCARAPVVWFVDDAQWADTASLDLLRYLAQRLGERAAPLLLVCTIRAEELASNTALASWLSGLQRDGALTRLDLAALSAGDTAALLDASGVGGRSFAEWLFAETGGQPLYLVETLKVLLDRGVLLADPGERLSVAGDLATLRGVVPPTVRSVIRARIDQLAPDTQALLTAAAVLGREADFEQICQVAGLAEPSGLAALDQALDRRVLVERVVRRPGRATGAGYAFTHDKIREIVYTEAGEARRRIYHRRALALLGLAPASERAHHALAAGLSDQALLYSIAAGDEALRLFAVQDALAAYAQAQALLDTGALDLASAEAPARLRQLFLQQGRAYELGGALDQAAAVYRRLLELARAQGWPALECAGLNRLGLLLVQQAVDVSAAEALLGQAVAAAERAGSAPDIAETEWNLAQLHFYNAQPARACEHGARALDLAREHGLAELGARSLNALALAHSAMARWDAAARYAGEASAAYAGLGNRALQADSLALLGCMRINQGRVAEGLRLADEADAISQAIGNVWGLATCAMTRAGGLLECGDYGAALAAAQAAARLARERQLGILRVLTLGVLGAAQRAALLLDTARATHLEAWELVAASGARLLKDMIAAELCADCALAGDWPAAAEHARAALAVRDDIFTLFMGREQWLQTAALVRVGEIELARADLARFDARIGQQPRYQIGSWCAHAALAAAAGDDASAAAAFERAAAMAEELGLPGEQWRILLALAGHYQARGAPERAVVARAAAETLSRRLADSLTDAPERAAFLAAAQVVAGRIAH